MAEVIAWPRKTQEVQTRIADSTIWNDFRFREGDIVIATYPKAGTTWTQQIVGQLLSGGDPDLEVWRLSPWVDMRIPPKAEKLALLEAQTGRRFVKTHLPLDALVFSPRARYIYVARDGRDTAWSYHHHHLSLTQGFRDLLNTLPDGEGSLMVPPPQDVREFWHQWLDGQYNPGTGSTYWDHVRGWWAIRDLPNVLLVHYARLKRDLPGEIRRVAAFLEVPVDESRWEAILEHCSFDWMKANAASVIRGDAFEGGARTFINRGVNGRWSDTLSKEEVAEYEARAVGELGEECAHWLATGELL